MSFDHLGLIANLELAATPKLILYALGNCACKACGLAWPGMTYLRAKTGLGETAISAGLKALLRDGHVTVRKYGHGGRGRTTEYIVIPGLWPPSIDAPCEVCDANMAKPAASRPVSGSQGHKPPATRPVSGGNSYIPAAQGPINPPPGGHHTVSNTRYSHGEDATASPPRSASPRISEPPQRPHASEAARRVGELWDAEHGIRREKPQEPRPDPNDEPTSNPGST